MSPAEFWQALDAHTLEIEADRIHTGELARGLGLRIFNLLVSRNGRITKAHNFWAMPWDEQIEGAENEEIDRLNSLSGDELNKEVELFYKRLNGGKKTKSED